MGAKHARRARSSYILGPATPGFRHTTHCGGFRALAGDLVRLGRTVLPRRHGGHRCIFCRPVNLAPCYACMLLPIGQIEGIDDVGGPAFRRRSTARVLAISGFILLTVWGLRYLGEASDVFRIAAEDGQGQPWGHVLDPWFIAKTCPQALLLLLAAVVGFCLVLRWKSVRPLERLILETLGEPATDGAKAGPARSWPWIVLGLATVAAALAILEWIEPCYFVQDDNFANVLPAVLHGCRSTFPGRVPRLRSLPIDGRAQRRQGSVLYPPTVVSYAIARWGLGNEYYTLDVFAAMHLLAGYLASFAAARTAGLRPALAFVLGISFTLSGYILLVGRGWHFVVAMVVWMPLLFCLMENWLQRASRLAMAVDRRFRDRRFLLHRFSPMSGSMACCSWGSRRRWR